jgi:hypothetical protein
LLSENKANEDDLIIGFISFLSLTTGRAAKRILGTPFSFSLLDHYNFGSGSRGRI